MKISILASDASTNCMGRAYILAQALSPYFKIELIAPMFRQSVWSPLDLSGFECKFVPAKNYPIFLKSSLQVLDQITGDVIYASKPLASSYGLALLSKLKKNALLCWI